MKIKYISFILTVALAGWISGCELTDLDINEDPNNPREASLDLLLANAISTASGVNGFADNINSNLHSFVGILAEQGTDGFALTNQTYNVDWQQLYSEPLKDVQGIIDIATEQGNNPYYLGIGQLLKAYYFSLMVDVWGDIPYSEALRADAEEIIKYPAYDDDAAIYQDLFRLVDEGIANLSQNSVVTVEGDPIYNGDIDKWIKMGKSLKLRLLLNTRRVQDNTAAITELISEGDLILEGGDDFTFQYSGINNPENDNRHPWYIDGYTTSEYGFTYLGNQFMVEMLDFEDPRRPFYVKRQTSSILDQNNSSDRQNTPCSQITGCIYGYLVLNNNMIDRLYTSKGKDFDGAQESFLAGIFGRDRSDPSGIPLDGSLRSALGVYPVAGLFDDGPEGANNNKATGAGLFPMITSEIVKFYMIESMLTLGVPGNPRTLLEEIMRDHIAKVAAFGEEIDGSAVPSPEDSIDSYINLTLDSATDAYVERFLTRFDNAPTNEAKLNVALKQAWFTNFGNGFEIYNAFRRTGYPNDLQEPLNRQRQFALRLPYAQDDLNFNQSVTDAVENTAFDRDPVFWDVLKYQFN
uniref:SusD/RagB family nutrient-binding outer membrane lipoprotein n=1 Tax=Roseihalotalea indica TaxID=2867963 RepID=A0AA49GPT7_9BACT|nr:SusD/RagB family nutrient-binding outer membrane lipoprotein [Tunicatimonas sp. TK19036]